MFSKIKTVFGLLLVIFSVVAAVPVSISDNKIQDENVLKFTTEVQVTKLRYEWTIKNLDFDNYLKHQTLNSSTFSAETNDKCQWYLFLYPRGINEESKDYVSIFVQSVSCNVSANVRLGFISANNDRIYNKTFTHSFTNYTSNWGYSKFVKQDILIANENDVFVNGTLTIFCEVIIFTTSENVSKKFKQLPHKDDLGKDLAFLLDNELFSDVIIASGGKEFRAHKGILAARSPIFKSIFQHDNHETNTTRVDITDVDVDGNVVKEMLRYIYTGEVSNLGEFAPNLLVAAEKYEVVGLKIICENAILANLTVENAVEFYVLGDTHSAANLKGLAKDFIVAHASDVTLTAGFKSLIQTHPLLVEELISAITGHNHKYE